MGVFIEIRDPIGSIFVRKSELLTELDHIQVDSFAPVSVIRNAIHFQNPNYLLDDADAQKLLLQLKSNYIQTIKQTAPLAFHPILQHKRFNTIKFPGNHRLTLSPDGDIVIHIDDTFYASFVYSQHVEVEPSTDDTEEKWRIKKSYDPTIIVIYISKRNNIVTSVILDIIKNNNSRRICCPL